MADLVNLIVDLDERFALSAQAARELCTSVPGVRIDVDGPADDRLLAWIDDTFGGGWSSEAYAGANVIAWRDDRPIGFATIDAQGLQYKWLRGVVTLPGVGLFGPFGITPRERKSALGPVLLQLALGHLRERGYNRALIAAAGGDRLIQYYERNAGARVAERFDRMALVRPRPRVVVMASGNGSNLQAVIDAIGSGELPVDLTALVTNNAQAYAIGRARQASIPVRIVPWKRSEESRAEYDARLFEIVATERPELIVLLGWMHLLAEPFVRAFSNLLNLHPAFLPLDAERDDVGTPDGARIPAFRGIRAVHDALAAGAPWIGATLHRVTPATDRGPVVVRKPMRVVPGETEEEVMARLHPVEHRLVVAGIMRWLYERADTSSVSFPSF